jgi:hypothetical protein
LKANHPEQHHYDTIRTTFDHDFSRISTNQILLDSNQKYSLPHKDLIHSSLKEKKNGTALVNDWRLKQEETNFCIQFSLSDFSISPGKQNKDSIII